MREAKRASEREREREEERNRGRQATHAGSTWETMHEQRGAHLDQTMHTMHVQHVKACLATPDTYHMVDANRVQQVCLEAWAT